MKWPSPSFPRDAGFRIINNWVPAFAGTTALEPAFIYGRRPSRGTVRLFLGAVYYSTEVLGSMLLL